MTTTQAQVISNYSDAAVEALEWVAFLNFYPILNKAVLMPCLGRSHLYLLASWPVFLSGREKHAADGEGVKTPSQALSTTALADAGY